MELKAFYKMLKDENLDIVLLMETRIMQRQLEGIRILINMGGCFGVDCMGLGGGLALLWNCNISMAIQKLLVILILWLCIQKKNNFG